MKPLSAMLAGVGVLGLVVSPAPYFAATRKKPASPAVSKAAQAAALKRVNAALDDPPDQPFGQAGALAPVFEQLMRMSANSDQPPLHVIQFGDSHTAADEWTGGLRDEFQQRFGNGGSGFSLAGRPFLGYRRFDIHGGGSALWHSEGLRTGAGDGFFGLGGVSIETARAGQSVYAQAECDSLEVDYLVQPGGGSVAVYVDEERRDEFSTEGEQMAPGAVRYELTPGPHSFKVVTLDSRPVRLFGWVADRNAGVTYEALGINGAEAAVMLKWNEIMLATYLQRRSPAMIVLSYGTNEATDPGWSQESYEAMFSTLLAELRQDAPTASILAIGPSDRWSRTRYGIKLVAGIDWVIAAQKRACQANRCAYWDTRERMGGRGSMRDWVYAGLGQRDYVHFTAPGYRRLAEALFTDLMGQYETYKKARTEQAGF
ncbi:MAG: SGNH/GDSL hydrolase family protein [Bryobacteraceae bacterium]